MDIKERVAQIMKDTVKATSFDSRDTHIFYIEEAADQIIPIVRADTLKIADSRIEALEDLLVCYRIGKHPTEKLLTKLDSSAKDWKSLQAHSKPKDDKGGNR